MINKHFRPVFLLIICLTSLPEVQGNVSDTTLTDHSAMDKSRYVTGGAGWAMHGLRDMGISPLYYSGSHIYGIIGYETKRNNQIQYIHAGFLSGAISPSIYPDLTDSRMKSFIGDYSYSYLRLAGNFGNGSGGWFLGGTFSGQLAYYKHNLFTNSAINQYLFNTAGINSRISYPLGNYHRELTMVFQIHIPLVAAVLRNSYAYIKPEGFLDHDIGNIRSFFESMELISVNKFSGANTDLYIEYSSPNYSKWRFGYQWEYFTHRNANLLKAARHGIYLKLMLYL